MALMIDRASDGELLGSLGHALVPVTAVVVTLIGLLATVGPARRGLRIQPTEALRAEWRVQNLLPQSASTVTPAHARADASRRRASSVIAFSAREVPLREGAA